MLYALCKAISSLYKLVTEVMFWFVMYINKSNESTHHEHVHFQGSNFLVLFTFKNKYVSSCSRFGAHIVSTVILTNYERTHKAATRQSIWNKFYWHSKTWPPFAHLLALSHVILYASRPVGELAGKGVDRNKCQIRKNLKDRYITEVKGIVIIIK